MPTEVIPLGYRHVMVQNRVYALPAVRGSLFCSTPAAVINASNDIAFAEMSNTYVFDNGSGAVECAGLFLRSTTANSAVIFKRA